MAQFFEPTSHRTTLTVHAGACGTGGELPFTIGVLGDFTGTPTENLGRLRDRRFVDVDLDNHDRVLEACRPHLRLVVSNRLTEEDDGSTLNVDLNFKGLDDFSPARIAGQVTPLRALLDLRRKLIELRAALRSREGLDDRLQQTLCNSEKMEQVGREINDEATPQPAKPVQETPPAQLPTPTPPEPGVWSRRRASTTSPAPAPSVLDQIAGVRSSRDAAEKEVEKETRDLIKEFLAQVAAGDIRVSRDTEMMINVRVAQLDRLVSLQLNEVLHHPDFQRLEACWRGLYFLLQRVRKAARVKVRLLNITKKELLRQFRLERGHNGSAVARKVLDQAALTPGESPYSLLVCGFDTGRHPEEMELMEKLALLGAAAHVPVIAAASPELLNVPSFTEIPEVEFLPDTFKIPEYAKWNALRCRPEARYLGFVLPRFLLRLPFGRDNVPIEEFDFEEHVDGTNRNKFLWGSGVWPLALRLALDFERYGWLGSPRDGGDRGDVADFPVFVFPTFEGDLSSIGPAELPINDVLYPHLTSMGMIPLCQVAGTRSVTFFELWSCHKPYVNPESDAPTTYESGQIDCMLDVSRIVHYLRAILLRERQRFATSRECEEYLLKWIAPYITPAYARGSSLEAAFPLLDVRFRVVTERDFNGRCRLEANILPRRANAALVNPVTISVAIALPGALTQVTAPETAALIPYRTDVPMAVPFTFQFTHAAGAGSGPGSGREQFIRHLFMAEASLSKGKLEVGMAILEDLSSQIDRCHLDEWESPQLLTQVWDLLRRCYLLSPSRSETADRAVLLLRRICRLDPTRAFD